jgi:hypothetical protein
MAASGVALTDRSADPNLNANAARNRPPVHEPAVAARPVVEQPPGPSTAREACGERGFVSMALCLDRECERPQFRNHPECVRVLEIKARRGDR